MRWHPCRWNTASVHEAGAAGRFDCWQLHATARFTSPPCAPPHSLPTLPPYVESPERTCRTARPRRHPPLAIDPHPHHSGSPGRCRESVPHPALPPRIHPQARLGHLRLPAAGLADPSQSQPDVPRRNGRRGRSELLLPAMLPIETYKDTKRDVDYGDLLFKVTDRKGGLGPRSDTRRAHHTSSSRDPSRATSSSRSACTRSRPNTAMRLALAPACSAAESSS